MYFVFTGPESSGKTTLSVSAKEKWGGGWVPEVAREYLSVTNGRYHFEDLKNIAEKQWLAEQDYSRNVRWTWCDTDLLTILVWSVDKFGTVDPWVKEKWEIQCREARFYFLCCPDIPWEFDPLRENPDDRDRIFELYRVYLEKYNVSYEIVKGEAYSRLQLVETTFQRYIKNLSIR